MAIKNINFFNSFSWNFSSVVEVIPIPASYQTGSPISGGTGKSKKKLVMGINRGDRPLSPSCLGKNSEVAGRKGRRLTLDLKKI